MYPPPRPFAVHAPWQVVPGTARWSPSYHRGAAPAYTGCLGRPIECCTAVYGRRETGSGLDVHRIPRVSYQCPSSARCIGSILPCLGLSQRYLRGHTTRRPARPPRDALIRKLACWGETAAPVSWKTGSSGCECDVPALHASSTSYPSMCSKPLIWGGR